MSEEIQEQTEAIFVNAEQEATETMSAEPQIEEAVVAEPQVKVLSPVEQCLVTLQDGLVQLSGLGRDQSNLVIEASSKIREAIKAIQEDARL